MTAAAHDMWALAAHGNNMALQRIEHTLCKVESRVESMAWHGNHDVKAIFIVRVQPGQDAEVEALLCGVIQYTNFVLQPCMH
jgi:hypothetical protein